MDSDGATGRAWQRFRPLLWVVVPAWFVAISLVRLSVLLPTAPGYDGMLYRDATIRWLGGGDPWAPGPGATFGAFPPTLLAMAPFALLPDGVARVVLILLGVFGNVWLLRRLRVPLWWIAFPPLVDGLYIANPQVLLAPLLVAGAGPVAAILKIHAAVVMVFAGEVRKLLIMAVVIGVTAPFLPWPQFLERWPSVQAAVAEGSGGGGLSVLGTPLLIPVAMVGAFILGRRYLAWWAVPTFWPFAQWYNASIALPVLSVTPMAAMALAAPVPGATALAIAIAALEITRLRRRQASTAPGAILGA